MSGQAPPQQLTARGYLDRIQDKYVDQLRGVSLGAEVPFHEDQLGDTVRALGRVYDRAHPSDGPRTREWRSRPAAVVLGLSAFAANFYRGSGWWTEISRISGVRKWSPHDAEAWGDAFKSACRRLDLPLPAHDQARANLGPIIMHGGIPTYSVEGLLDEIVRLRDRLASVDGAEIVADMLQRSRPSSVHEPAFDFLKQGGIFAYDIVQRMLDAVDLAQAGEDPGLAQLPDRIGREVGRLLAGDGPSHAHQRARHQQVRATLTLDPWGDGLVLVVPADREHSWRVTMDRAHETLEPSYSVSSADQRPRRLVLRHPARIIGAHPAQTPLPPIQLYDAVAPLAAFMQDGAFIPEPRPIPASSVWLLHPISRSVDVDDTRILEEAPLPLGWDGWILRLHDLSGLEHIGLVGGPARPVQRLGGPQLLLPEPAAMLTFDGAAVFTTRPHVNIPEGTGPQWTLWIQFAGDVQSRRSIPVHGKKIDPWAEVVGTVVGGFDLEARGPLGRGWHRRVYVAEGVAAASTPAFRAIQGSGLAQATVTVTGPPDIAITPDVMTLDARTTAVGVQAQTATASISLTVTPAHRWFRYMPAGAGARGERHYSPLLIHSEDVIGSGPGVLDIGIGSGQDDFRLLLRADQLDQVVVPDRVQRRDRRRFDLRPLADTVRKSGSGDLFLVTPESQELAARIRPKTLHAGGIIDDGVLALREFCGRDDIMVALWPTLAPWRTATVLAVSPDGRLTLPDDLHAAGPLLFMAALSDPWVPWTPPAWPERGSAAVALQIGQPMTTEPGERALIDFLAGRSDDCGHDLTLIWKLLSRAATLPSPRPDLMSKAGQCLTQRPADSFRTLAASPPPPDELPEVLIRSGLAAQVVGGLDESTRALLWQISGAVGLLACGAEDRVGEPLVPDSDVPTARQSCGESVERMVKDRVDPYATCGAFDVGVDAASVMSAPRRKALIRSMSLVPKALLDGDTRVVAALALFERRNDSALQPMQRVATDLVNRALKHLQMQGLDRCRDAILVRRHPSNRIGWREFSALSLIFAVCARLAARGDATAIQFEFVTRGYWGIIASLAPDLVMTDLALAELLVYLPPREKGES